MGIRNFFKKLFGGGLSDTLNRIRVVKAGDTLSQIALEEYGDASKYMKIFDANRSILSDPDKIRPGQKLIIPNA